MTIKKTSSRARKPRVTNAHKKKRISNSPLLPTWQHASELVKRLIVLMEDGIDSHDVSPEHWERIFGTKDSAVANLQKLVAVLSLIADHAAAAAPEPSNEKIAAEEPNPDEYEMLMRWLEKELADPPKV